MRFAKKRQAPFRAFPLGEDHPLERELIRSGRLLRRADGAYEVFSQEAKGETGEIARPRDYVKIDSAGYPYPNSRQYFEKDCIPVGDGLYVSAAPPVAVWLAGDPPCDFISFLLATGRLRLDEADDRQYFQAELWGAPLSAPRDAAVVAYVIERGPDGTILDVDFNFVEKSEFEKTYEWC